MLRFVNTDNESFDRKRKYSQRACESCRRKKKRCSHATKQGIPAAKNLGASDTNRSTKSLSSPKSAPSRRAESYIHSEEQVAGDFSSTGHETADSTADQSLLADNTTASQARPSSHPTSSIVEESRPLDSRFIGALNPEGIFLAATSPENLRGASAENGHDVGVWLADKLGSTQQLTEGLKTPPPSSLLYGFNISVQKVFSPLLGQECFSSIPPAAHRDALCAVYFHKIHPIFPIIKESDYQSLPNDSPSHILLTQGLCLVASMDFSSRPHLVFVDGEGPLAFKDFGKRIMTAMRVSIELGLVTDKIILIQALTLMSFFIDSREGSETASLMIARAAQYVHWLGLHLQGRDSEPDREYAATIFCCVWILDRLNAALHGRPVIMHERDIGRSLRECFSTQSPPFRLICRVVELLDNVIRLYRPRNVDEENLDFPLFEDLVVQCDAFQVSTSTIGTIEVLYHAIAMLSCRSRPGDIGDATQIAAKTRQALSAERLTAMVGHGISEELILLPFVPYAISLSLSVAYRDMRRSKIQMHRARARNILETNCRILETLGEIFWSAAEMAEMGKKTLKELDRVCLNITDPNAYKISERSNPLSKGSHPLMISSLCLNPSFSQATTRALRIPSKRLTANFCIEGVSQDVVNGSRRPSTFLDINSGMDQGFNPFFYNDLPDMDPFEMFDPQFDLDAIDTCLEQHLDLGIPMGLH